MTSIEKAIASPAAKKGT